MPYYLIIYFLIPCHCLTLNAQLIDLKYPVLRFFIYINGSILAQDGGF